MSDIKLDLPERKEDEPDLTSNQSNFIDSLLSSIEGKNLNFKNQKLGKWQASSLIDQLINLRDNSTKLVSEPKNKKISLILGVGIFVIPFVFSWVTLLPGYSSKARIVSISWAMFAIFTVFFQK